MLNPLAVLMVEFDLESEVNRLKAETRSIRLRKPRYRSSRLDKHSAELLLLKKSGVSNAEITRWLRSRHIKVSPSTVGRWLKKNG